MNIVIIDDEADQASLNTKKMREEEIERTKINKLILELVNCKNFILLIILAIQQLHMEIF